MLALTIGAMLQAETMNTSVERLCDFVKPQPDPQIRDVKDLAAGAVVITALAAVAVGACLFLRRDAWLLFVQIITTPGHCATLVLAFLAAAAFVVLPGKRKENTGK